MMQEQLSRTEMLIGSDGLEKLKNARETSPQFL